jgi:hypothetical protein
MQGVKYVGTDEEIFHQLAVKAPEGECWEWLGAKSHGYAMLSRKHASHIALQVAGKQKTASAALHSCDNPGCVNPDHLRWGTAAENVADMVSRNRHHANRRTHCIHGHSLSGHNLIQRRNGQRGCRTCQSRLDKESRQRRKEKRNVR